MLNKLKNFNKKMIFPDIFSKNSYKKDLAFQIGLGYFFKNSVMKGKRTDYGRGTGLAKSHKSESVRIKGRPWLEKDGENLLSWGRVVLLERIRETASIAAAARSMKMA